MGIIKMKLTPTKLKSLILEVLEEGARTIEDLPEGIFITVEETSDDEVSIDISYEDGGFISKNNKGIPWGGVALDYDVPLFLEHPCLGAMVVTYTSAADGFGPLLYDIAIEVATILGGGLVSDRTIVSNSAYNVWDYYSKNRSDVEIIQLDNEDSELTPRKDDDCLQNIAYEYAEKLGTEWHESPLSKLYRKPPTTLKSLGDKLILKNINLQF